MSKATEAPNTTKSHFGNTKGGEAVEQIILQNRHGLKVSVITYGATVTQIEVPDNKGVMGNIALGFDNVKDYEDKSPYFGATVGRVANRIAKGTFELDGKTYKLAVNNGPNTLHGGLKGFDKKVWRIADEGAGKATVKLESTSADMEENFPGKLETSVRFTLTDEDELVIEYEAVTDKATPVNLTNHTYFNLAGAGKGTILDHELSLHGKAYTPVDANLIPTGEIKAVEGTPFDFRTSHKISERIGQLEGGYDHNFVKDDGVDVLARVHDKQSGRILEMTTTEPGVQFYTGNFLDGTVSGIGGKYLKNGAFCLEAQHFPDAVHHANFPSIIVKPGDTYRQTTKYRFSVSD